MKLTIREVLRQGLSSTAGVYDWIAPRFDATPFRTPDRVVEVLARQIGATGPVDRALDIGCGTGAVTQAVMPLCREMIVGLDLSRGMIEVARRAAARWAGAAKVAFCRGDALAIPLQGEFDLVVTSGMLVHLPGKYHRRFAAEVWRVLRPGGRFVLVTGDMPSRLSLAYWVWKTFNAIMHIRNFVWRPRFPLTKLNFAVTYAEGLLREQGFEVNVRRGLLDGPLRRIVVIVARRSS